MISLPNGCAARSDPTETAAEAAAPDAPPTPKVRTASTDTAGSLRTSKRFRRNP